MRRLAIVIAVLACVGGYTAWRMSWRGDPRFVGRWVFVSNIDGLRIPVHMQFQSNGAGAVYDYTQDNSRPLMTFDWWVEDSQLVSRPHRKESGLELLTIVVREFWSKLHGEKVRQRTFRKDVLEIAAVRLRMDPSPSDGQHFVLDKMSPAEIESAIQSARETAEQR